MTQSNGSVDGAVDGVVGGQFSLQFAAFLSSRSCQLTTWFMRGHGRLSGDYLFLGKLAFWFKTVTYS